MATAQVKPPVSAWVCPLCGELGRKTIEHVIPDWAYSDFIKGDPLIAVRNVVAKQKYVKIHLCAICNAWLNDTFEIPGKTLISRLARADEPTLLSKDEQVFAASYLTKYVLLNNLWVNMPTDPLISKSDYRRFRSNGEPMRNSSMWVTSLDVENLPDEHTQVRPPPVQQQFLRGSTGGLFIMNRLVVRWFKGPEFAFDAPQNGLGQRLLKQMERERLLVRVWPPHSGRVTFPPPWPMRLEVHVSMRDVFKRHPEDGPAIPKVTKARSVPSDSATVRPKP